MHTVLTPVIVVLVVAAAALAVAYVARRGRPSAPPVRSTAAPVYIARARAPFVHVRGVTPDDQPESALFGPFRSRADARKWARVWRGLYVGRARLRFLHPEGLDAADAHFPPGYAPRDAAPAGPEDKYRTARSVA